MPLHYSGSKINNHLWDTRTKSTKVHTHTHKLPHPTLKKKKKKKKKEQMMLMWFIFKESAAFHFIFGLFPDPEIRSRSSKQTLLSPAEMCPREPEALEPGEWAIHHPFFLKCLSSHKLQHTHQHPFLPQACLWSDKLQHTHHSETEIIPQLSRNAQTTMGKQKLFPCPNNHG